MAHKRLELELRKTSVDYAMKYIENEAKEELLAKVDEFVKRIAEEGADYAKLQILNMRAIDTSTLHNSIDIKPGQVISNGSSWIIFTDCYYAQYVEFGTGTQGAKNPHPSGKGKYNQDLSNKVRNPFNKNDPDLGWFYGGTWTSGMASRPFMYNTAEFLKMDALIKRVAKEVFG